MRITFLTLLMSLTCNLFFSVLPVCSENRAIENQLVSLVNYLPDGSARRCNKLRNVFTDATIPGKRVSDMLPLSELQSIDIQGNLLSLPASLVAKTLVSGRIGKWDPRAFPIGILVCMRFKDGSELPMTVFPLAGQLFHQAKIGGAWVELPSLPTQGATECLKAVSDMKLGQTTRKEFEQHFYVDGGLSAVFSAERFVFQGYKSPDGVLKVYAAFRPSAISDQVYAARELQSTPSPISANTKQTPDDVLMRVSPVFQELPFFN